VADDDVGATHLTQHRCSHLTREGALPGLGTNVLSAKTDSGLIELLSEFSEVDKWRTQHDFRDTLGPGRET
jgi:hypothetical protein